MTPIYLKTLCWLLTALAALAVFAISLVARVCLRLHLTYPMTQPPRLPLSSADWPFCLRLAKFLSKQVRLKKLHCQIKLSGRPDICALTGGALVAGLHSLSAAANCRDTNVQLQLAPNEQKSSGEFNINLTLPLWVIIAATLRLIVYFFKRKSIIKSTEIN